MWYVYAHFWIRDTITYVSTCQWFCARADSWGLTQGAPFWWSRTHAYDRGAVICVYPNCVCAVGEGGTKTKIWRMYRVYNIFNTWWCYIQTWTRDMFRCCANALTILYAALLRQFIQMRIIFGACMFGGCFQLCLSPMLPSCTLH